MSDPPREVTSEVRGTVWFHNTFVPGGIVLVFWLLYLLTLVLGMMGYVLVERNIGGRVTAYDSPLMLTVALIISAIFLPIIVMRLRTAFHLARHGIEITGTVRRELGVTIRGVDTVLVSYTVDGSAFTKKLSRGLFEKEEKGAPVELVVDPANPTRCMLREAVLPAQAESTA